MFVQVAVRNGESAQVCARIADIVKTAVQEALGADFARSFVQLISRGELMSLQPRRADEPSIAVLVIAAEKFTEAKKRRLFGRLAESFSRELNIRGDQIVTGVIETPRENWSNGYGERQWLQYLSYQLP